ncbi:uncharacterized protein Fot_40499 [Forsythia ovata]|uniref:Uncharacterized protein n=1 Tax=Forsythia ovata TaxID=205694 RepID=A0ABD1S7P5_9LAMI
MGINEKLGTQGVLKPDPSKAGVVGPGRELPDLLTPPLLKQYEAEPESFSLSQLLGSLANTSFPSMNKARVLQTSMDVVEDLLEPLSVAEGLPDSTMSGTYGNFIPRENRQPGRDDWNERRPYITNSHSARRSLPGQDDWNQFRPFVTDSRPAGRYLNPRGRALDPRWFFEDTQTGGPASLASSSSPAPTHTPIRFLLIENDTARNTYPTYRQPVPDSPPPRYYEPQYSQPSEPESNFTKEEQEKGLNKLRKRQRTIAGALHFHEI